MREISYRRFFIVAAVLVIGVGAFLGYRVWDPGWIRGSFDVGDRSLYLECVGEGAPTIVMETGNGGDHTAWEDVVPSVRNTNQTCTYDRANLGASDDQWVTVEWTSAGVFGLVPEEPRMMRWMSSTVFGASGRDPFSGCNFSL